MQSESTPFLGLEAADLERMARSAGAKTVTLLRRLSRPALRPAEERRSADGRGEVERIHSVPMLIPAKAEHGIAVMQGAKVRGIPPVRPAEASAGSLVSAVSADSWSGIGRIEVSAKNTAAGSIGGASRQQVVRARNAIVLEPCPETTRGSSCGRLWPGFAHGRSDSGSSTNTSGAGPPCKEASRAARRVRARVLVTGNERNPFNLPRRPIAPIVRR